MSNTSKGLGNKGSKFWIQKLVNLDNGNALTKEIQKKDASIDHINWISLLKHENYEEYKLNSKRMIEQLEIATSAYAKQGRKR